jgi:hypothetical protein
MNDDLTRRDLIAALVFAGMHAKTNDPDERFAVIQADRLIEALKIKGKIK